MDEEIPVHVRNIKCELGIINRADGSAMFQQGETSGTCIIIYRQPFYYFFLQLYVVFMVLQKFV